MIIISEFDNMYSLTKNIAFALVVECIKYHNYVFKNCH